MELKSVVYTSEKKINLFKELKDIKSSNFLAIQMAKRDLQAQYRQSYLGLLWAFLPVIVNYLVWIFLNSSGAINVNALSGIPYPLYVIIVTAIFIGFLQTYQIKVKNSLLTLGNYVMDLGLSNSITKEPILRLNNIFSIVCIGEKQQRVPFELETELEIFQN